MILFVNDLLVDLQEDVMISFADDTAVVAIDET